MTPARRPRPGAARAEACGARSKYGNRPVVHDGYRFGSQKEALRYLRLKFQSDGGEIIGLEVHPKFQLVVNRQTIARYEADFSYYRDGRLVVEDVKSEPTKTPVYRLKRRLMQAIYDITITEI